MKFKEGIRLFIILGFAFVLIILSGCDQENSKSQKEVDETTAFQILYDNGSIVKEFADEQIDEYIKPFNSDYVVVEAAYRFETAEKPHYVIRYKLNNGIHDLFYGYKITVDHSGNCTILDEGTDTSKTLLE